jgi:hypothetical protein
MHEDDDSDGEKKTIEAWAEEKGYLPEFVTVPARLGSREVPRKRQNPKFPAFAMGKAHRRWPQGKEVTEAEFDEAIKEGGQVALK